MEGAAELQQDGKAQSAAVMAVAPRVVDRSADEGDVKLLPKRARVPVRNCYMYVTLGLSMELNDDILVQTTPPQTIARIKRVKCFMLQKVA